MLDYPGAREQVPGAPRERPRDRRRRRHGRPALERGAAPALPRGGERPRARERRRRASELHPGRRGADRDEHVRREPPQAGRALPRGRARGDRRRGREVRTRRARGRPGRTSSSRGRSGRCTSTATTTRSVFAEQAQLLDGRGVDLFTVETFTDLDQLVTAIEAVRSVSSLPIVALLTFDDEDAETLAGVSARDAAERLRGLDVAAFGANCGAGPTAALAALGEMAGDGAVLATAAEHRPREPLGRPHRLPARDPGLLRRVRRSRPHARRTDHRRLLRHHARADRGDRGGRRRRARARRPRRCSPTATSRPPRPRPGARPALARALRESEWVVSVELDPPQGGNSEAMLAVARRARGVGSRRLRRHQRQPDGPRADERADGRRRDRAQLRDRDDPARHPARHDGDGARVGPARRARRGRPQRARGHRRPAARSATIRARRACTRSTRSGSSQLLARLNAGESWSGKAIDAPTSFFTGVAVNPAADDLDTELERFERKLEAGAQFAMTQALFELDSLDELLAPARRLLADPAPRRDLAAAQPPARAAAAQRGARDRRPGPTSRRRCARRGRTRPRSASSWRGRSTRSAARRRRAST